MTSKLRGERPYALPPKTRLHTVGRFVRTGIWVVVIHVVLQGFGSNILSPQATTVVGKLWCIAIGIVLGHVVATAMMATRHRDLGHGTLWGAFGFRKIGFSLVLKITCLAIVYAGLVAVVMDIVEREMPEKFLALPINIYPAYILAVLILSVPFFEEVLFRGYLLPYVARFTNRFVATIIITAIFVSLHGQQLKWFAPPLIAIAGLSLILCALRFRFASLWVCVIFHFVYNMVFAVIAIVDYVSGPPHPAEIMDNPSLIFQQAKKELKEESHNFLDTFVRAAQTLPKTSETSGSPTK